MMTTTKTPPSLPARLIPVLCLLMLLASGPGRADDSHALQDQLAAEAEAFAEPFVANAAPPAPEESTTMGQWGPVISWTPHIPVSIANLPDGRLLTFASNQRTTFPAGSEFTYAATWDPKTGAFIEYNHTTHDMFCGGMAMLPDGRVMVNGGRNETVRASVFDWRTNTWTRIQNMTGGRWYNTTVALPDGQAWTATGSGTGKNTSEIWSQASGWRQLTGINWSTVFSEAGYIKEWHPLVSLAPDGRLLHFGPTDIMRWITHSGNGSLTNAGTNVPGAHYPKEGAWIMYEEGRVLVAGGGANTTASSVGDGTTGTSTNLAYTVNLNTVPPTVASIASMANTRQFANAVVLPNGEVLIIGGNTSGRKFNDTGSVLPCEMWNPRTGQWRTVASISVPRNYHSCAILLPDGRVWSGGGGLSGNSADHRDAQLYTPPALLDAAGALRTRPVLNSAPPEVGPGVTFTVTGTPGLAKFSLIKMSALTHSVNTDVRYLTLPFAETSPGTYSLTSRTNLNVMTTGYWMLFGILPNGAYSEARVIRVDSLANVTLADPGAQNTVVGSPASLALAASAPAASTRVFTAAGLPPGLACSASTGLITGTPSTSGSYNVTASVTAAGQTATRSFIWTVHAATLRKTYTNFTGATGLVFAGNAALSGSVLRLTPNTINRTGAAWLTPALPVQAGTSFTTRFVFRQHGTADGADGLAFVVQGTSGTAIGTGGSGLGYEGIGKSLAVEIDSYQGTGDPNGNHLGVLTNGSVTSHLATHTPSFDLENAASHTLWVEYDGNTDTLRVFLAQGVVAARPASPVITRTGIDLAALAGGSAWIGFTGAAGGVANNHDIEAWDLTVNAYGLPVAPLLANPGSQASVLGSAVSLQITATDGNQDPLTFSSTGLPAGLSLNSSTGRVTGTPTAAGSSNVTVTVSDGSASVSAAFTWVVNAPLSVTLPGAPAQASGSAVTFTAGSTGGANPRYRWDFGDGSPATAYSASPTASHAYAAPGRYLVTVTATDDTGRTVTQTFYQAVHGALTARRPAASSPIVFEDRAMGNDRVWCVNPDQGSVSVYDAVTRTRLREIAVGAVPHSVAVAPNGRIWVACAEGDQLSLIDPGTFAVVQTVTLPRGARPFGLAFDPAGAHAWLACEGSGRLLRFHPTTAAQTGSVEVGPHARHVSVPADGGRVLVSRFITPLVPGENGVGAFTSAGGGEVVAVNAATLTVERTVILQQSTTPDTAISGRGVPNYLGPAIISPDGRSAWVASKQDNIRRGVLRDGNELTHDLTVRTVSSRIDLASGIPATDTLANRIDHDNAGLPSTGAFDPSGVYLFTVIEGSREVAVSDAWQGKELLRFDAGRAPQGIAFSPDGGTAFVHNFMDRSVTVHDLAGLLSGQETPPSLVATMSAVTTETLSAQVLRGKQLFYDAKDGKLSLQTYMSCASCHNEGGQDGRVWDLTGFGEGLRNTIDLRGRGGMDHGPLHWSANFDEVQDFDNQIRDLAGGDGLIDGNPHPPMGPPNAGRSADLDALAAYVASLKTFGKSPHRTAGGALTPDAIAGRELFRTQNCAACHSGARFTDSALGVFHDVGTIKPATGQRLGATLTGLDTPTLRGLWDGAPFLHDGSAPTLEAAIAAHQGVNLSATQLNQLGAYLRQIDGDEPPAPSNGQPSLTVPANRSDRMGGAVPPLVVTATDPDGDALTFSATGLPPGLSLDSAAGRVTGTPSEQGAFAVTLTVRDASGASATGAFTWTILSPATVPSIPAFTASPASLMAGEASTLSWTVSDGDSPLTALTLSGVGDVMGSVSRTVSPSETTVYTLTATNAMGTRTATVTVTVSARPGGGEGGGPIGGGIGTAGLVAEWPLDEGAGTTAADVSGQNQMAGLIHGATWAAGASGSAVRVDGRAAALRLANSPDMGLGTADGDFTVSLWYRLDQDATGYWRGIAKQGDTGAQRGFSLYLYPDTNQVGFSALTSAGWEEAGGSANPLTVGEWTHLGFVKRGGRLELFLNGELESVVSLGGQTLGFAAPLYFGASPDDGMAAAGSYDGIRVHRRALTTAEMRTLGQQWAGQVDEVALLARLPLDEGSGTQGADASGKGRHGVLQNATWTAGHSGQAVSVDGAGGTLRLANQPDMRLGAAHEDFTVTLWYRLRSGADGYWRGIAKQGDTGEQRGFSLYLYPGTNQVGFSARTTAGWEEAGGSASALTVGQWTHLGFVKRGDRLELYLDGEVESVISLSGRTIGFAAPFYFGASPDDGFSASGAYDDIRFDGRAVSPEEMRSLAGGSAVQAPVAPLHLTFDEGTGTAAADALGSARKGTLSGGAAWTAGQRAGAVRLDGQSGQVRVPHSPELNLGAGNGDFTVGFWVNLRAGHAGQWRALAKKGNAWYQRAFGLYLFPDSNRVGYALETDLFFNESGTSSRELVVGQWTHVVFVRRGATMEFWLDGVLDSSAPILGATPGNNGALFLGNGPDDAGFTQADYDDLWLLPRALDAAGIGALSSGAGAP